MTDLPVRQGNTYAFIFTFKDADGDAIDLTGDTVIWRCETATEGVYITKSTADTTLSWDAEAGEVTLSLSTANTIAMSPGKVNRWELEWRTGTDEKTVSHGFMVVEEGVNNNA